MRLLSGFNSNKKKETRSIELVEFSKWILNVGYGKICEPNDGLVDIEVPHEILISSFKDPIKAISTYPNLLKKLQKKKRILTMQSYFCFDH